MHSLTITITAPPAPDYIAAAEELSTILDQFGAWNDPTSVELHTWGTSVLQAVIEHRHDPADVIDRIAREGIAILTNEILINLIDKQPLQDPVIEREWTWERSMYNDCRKLFSAISPLDKLPMSPHPLDHDFAAAMIHWKNQLMHPQPVQVDESPSSSGEQQQVALVDIDISSQKEEIRRFIYQRLCSAAILTRQNRQQRARMDDTQALVDQFMVQVKEQDALVIGEARAQAAEHEAALRKQIDSINATYRETEALRNDRIDALRKKLAALENQLAATDQANTATVEELTRQIDAMRVEHQQAISVSEHEREVDRQEYQQTVARLEDQLSSTTRANQEAMSSITQTHSRTVDGLQVQITEATTQLNQTHDHLVAAETRNLQNEREIQNLRMTQAAAQQEIRRLREEASHSGHSRCIIM